MSHLPGNRPDTAIYDPSDGTLTIGDGVVTDITLDVWDYEVGGMPVIEQWLGATADPGARRRQSRLDLITVDAWEAGWTAELLLRPVRPHRAAQPGGGAAGAAGRGAAGAAPRRAPTSTRPAGRPAASPDGQVRSAASTSLAASARSSIGGPAVRASRRVIVVAASSMAACSSRMLRGGGKYSSSSVTLTSSTPSAGRGGR